MAQDSPTDLPALREGPSVKGARENIATPQLYSIPASQRAIRGLYRSGTENMNTLHTDDPNQVHGSPDCLELRDQDLQDDSHPGRGWRNASVGSNSSLV